MRIRYIRPILLAVAILFCSLAASTARAQVVISVAIAPPELPVYEQPVCPGDGYIWTPGYWAWDGDDYYWVPGTWVEAPEVGYFWTPPYWGWGGAAFIFHEGYWGPHIGFYGGINYGFGYFGEGFVGGRWDGGHFYYNRSVTNVNVTVIHNVYNERVNEREVTHVSYNGGRGGIEARPTREQETYDRERHVPPAAAQQQHVQQARSNRELRASVNHGAPPIAATPKAGAFNDRNVAPTRGGANARGAENTKGGGEARNNTRSETTPSGHANPPAHVRDLQPVERHPSQPTGNAKVDQKYQKQQQQLSARQDQERQKMQQKQDQEHQRYTQQKATEARTQQLEQKHQQQTQQLQQRHVQQQQHLEQRQQPQQSHQASAPKEKR